MIGCVIKVNEVDNLVIGGGYFGIYAASNAPKNESVRVIDSQRVLQGASKYNQARLHSGAHYLRSPETIRKCQTDLEFFLEEFGSTLNDTFQSVYALPIHNNMASPETFEHLMNAHKVNCKPTFSSLLSSSVSPKQFLVSEPTIDHYQMCRLLLARLGSNVMIDENIFGLRLVRQSHNNQVLVQYENQEGSFEYRVNKRLIFAAYDSNPKLISMLGLTSSNYVIERARILYAFIPQLQHLGFTLVEGQYISVIPWGNTGLHSITSVKHSHSTAQTKDQIDALILKHVRSFFECTLDFYVHEERSINKIFWNPNPVFDDRITSIQRITPDITARPQIVALNSSKLSSLHEVRSIFND